MNRMLILLAGVLLGVSTFGYAQGRSGHGVPYDVYTSYFEKNNSRLPGASSHLVLTTQDEFDRVFGAAAIMGKNSFLPEHVFPKRMVVATILRGDLRHYQVTEVEVRGKSLRVACTVKQDPPGSAQFSSPLILAVDRGSLRTVMFVENGKVVATVPVP